MRISDWSSDVCSSDLQRACDLPPRYAFEGRVQRRRARVQPRLHPHRARAALFGPDGGDVREIGRASCRERVCQYVKISVVAVSFKKKKILERLYVCIATVVITNTYISLQLNHL